MPRALKVTEKTRPYLVEEAAKFNLSVDDELEGVIDESHEYKTAIYAITDVSPEGNCASFTEMWAADFFRTWKFVEAESDTELAEIVKL
jgi:hypothetical protein